MVKKILIILSFMAVVGARHAVPLQGLLLPPDTAFAATQENGQPCPPECVTDSMEIVTWYPSPYNEYEELRLYPTQRDPGDCNNDKIGLMYYDHGGTPSFPDNDKMMICKGTLLGWQEVGGEGLWKSATGNTNDIYYTQSGNVGIGTDTPQAKLHVVGDIKIGNSSAMCNASNEGTIRYNATTKALELCNSFSWRAFSMEISTCGDWVSSYTISTPYVENNSLASADACKQWCSQNPGPSRTTSCSWQKRFDFITTRCYSGYGASSTYYQDSAGYPILQATTCS